MTILRDYVIFGHHSSLFAPKSNSIRIPIKYDRSVLEIEVTFDSIIHIVGYPKIFSIIQPNLHLQNIIATFANR